MCLCVCLFVCLCVCICVCVSPDQGLQLSVQEPHQGTACYDLSVAVVQREAAVAHVLAVDALGSRGNADHLRLLNIRAWMGMGTG